jgi:hypothetical protein
MIIKESLKWLGRTTSFLRTGVRFMGSSFLTSSIWLSYLLQRSYFGFGEKDQASGLFIFKINFVETCGRTAGTGLSTDRQRNITLAFTVAILVWAGLKQVPGETVERLQPHRPYNWRCLLSFYTGIYTTFYQSAGYWQIMCSDINKSVSIRRSSTAVSAVASEGFQSNAIPI